MLPAFVPDEQGRNWQQYGLLCDLICVASGWSGALIFTKRVAEKVNCSNSPADPPAGKKRACAEREGHALYSDTCYVL